MNSIIVLLTLSAGQGPGTATPATPGYSPSIPVVPIGVAAEQPATLPDTIPMQVPMVATPTPAPVANGNGNGNGNAACPTCEEKKEEEAPAPTVYLLEKSLRETWLGKKMAEDGYRLYGWTAMNYSTSTSSTTNLPMAFNDSPNRFQMNQNWIHFEKGIDTSKKEFQWGFVTDSIVPGTDARFTLSRGLFDQQNREGKNGGPVEYPIDLFQAYGQFFLPNLGAGGTTVKVGKFATHCGYELVQAVDTPFVSKSYLFQYDPFTHTGVWATTQLNDTWSVGNGFSTGADTFIDPANRLTYLAQIKWAPPEGKTAVLFNAMITNPKFDVAENFAFYNYYDLQIVHNFTDKLTYVLDASYAHMNNVPNVGTANWYGMANYFIYKCTDKVIATLRAEVFEDSSGFRTGFEGLYTEVTAGVAWTPVDSLILRPSVRYDYNGNSRPFDGEHHLWSCAFEAILRW